MYNLKVKHVKSCHLVFINSISLLGQVQTAQFGCNAKKKGCEISAERDVGGTWTSQEKQESKLGITTMKENIKKNSQVRGQKLQKESIIGEAKVQANQKRTEL